METLSNVASTASRVVFGQKDESSRESGTEPVSGVTGAGKADDPYDGGNRQDLSQSGTAGANASPTYGDTPEQITQSGFSNTGSYQDTSRTDDHVGGTSYQSRPQNQSDRGGSFDNRGADHSAYAAPSSEPETSKRLPDQYTATSEGHNTSFSSTDYSSQRLPGQHDKPRGPSAGIAQDGVPQGRNLTGSTMGSDHEIERTGKTGLSYDPKPSVDYPSSSNADSTGGNAGLTRGAIGGFGTAEPSVGADPSSGQKPMAQHQGGNRPHEEPTGEALQAVRREKEAADRALHGGSHSAEHHSSPTLRGDTGSEHKGTGEKWVKSTGTAAEGGNFDAAKPGAGKECDRLMELQGVHRAEKPGQSSEDLAGQSTGQHGHAVAEKLKDKLHLGHKH